MLTHLCSGNLSPLNRAFHFSLSGAPVNETDAHRVISQIQDWWEQDAVARGTSLRNKHTLVLDFTSIQNRSHLGSGSSATIRRIFLDALNQNTTLPNNVRNSIDRYLTTKTMVGSKVTYPSFFNVLEKLSNELRQNHQENLLVIYTGLDHLTHRELSSFHDALHHLNDLCHSIFVYQSSESEILEILGQDMDVFAVNEPILTLSEWAQFRLIHFDLESLLKTYSGFTDGMAEVAASFHSYAQRELSRLEEISSENRRPLTVEERMDLQWFNQWVDLIGELEFHARTVSVDQNQEHPQQQILADLKRRLRNHILKRSEFNQGHEITLTLSTNAANDRLTPRTIGQLSRFYKSYGEAHGLSVTTTQANSHRIQLRIRGPQAKRFFRYEKGTHTFNVNDTSNSRTYRIEVDVSFENDSHDIDLGEYTKIRLYDEQERSITDQRILAEDRRRQTTWGVFFTGSMGDNDRMFLALEDLALTQFLRNWLFRLSR